MLAAKPGDQMNDLAIHTIGDELEASAAFCRSEGIGIEVTDFAIPANLDSDMADRIARVARAVEGIEPVICHGPFYDLVGTRHDPAIVEVARRRHRAALAASREVGAGFYIAHTSFTPIIRNPFYSENWPTRMLDFWLPFADEAGRHNIVICLENIWEPEPDIQADLIAAGGHPHLRASFDNGHVLVFSSRSSSYWVGVLGEAIAHSHLHDNAGEVDEHKPVGEGNENWPELLGALRTHAPRAVLVAESGELANNKLSLERLRKFQRTEPGDLRG
jgi:sugar phosphate isomerase/epimerase